MGSGYITKTDLNKGCHWVVLKLYQNWIVLEHE